MLRTFKIAHLSLKARMTRSTSSSRTKSLASRAMARATASSAAADVLDEAMVGRIRVKLDAVS